MPIRILIPVPPPAVVNAHLILYFSGHPPVRLVNIIRTAGASFIIRA